MPDPVTGVLGGGIVANVIGGRQAAKAAKGAANQAADAQEELLQFEREKYNDWQAIYGGLQENLSSYYNSLSPEYYATRGIQEFEKERQLALDTVKQNLAQRGLSDSGLIADVTRTSELQGAETRAQIRANAPAQAREEQFRFLQAGLGLNPGASLSSALGQVSSQANRENLIVQQQASQAIGGAIQSVGSGLSEYFGAPNLFGGKP